MEYNRYVNCLSLRSKQKLNYQPAEGFCVAGCIKGADLAAGLNRLA